jgi:hypothetical protein
MNEFDALLPRRVHPPALPGRGGVAAAAAAARARRRRHAARVAGAGTAATLAVAGVAALRPAPGSRGLREVPASTPTSAPPDDTSPAPEPGGPGPDQASRSAEPSGPQDATPPAYTESPEPEPSDWGTPQPWLDTVRYTVVDRTVVPDRPAEPCGTQGDRNDRGGSVYCFRYVGATDETSGTAADLAWEWCARTGDVTAHFESSQEVQMYVNTDTSPSADGAGKNVGTSSKIVWRDYERATAVGAHDETIKAGTCARYTAHWDGLDNDGRPLPPATYALTAWILDSAAQVQVGPYASLTVH